MSKKAKISYSVNLPLLKSATILLEHNSKNEFNEVLSEGPKLKEVSLGVSPRLKSLEAIVSLNSTKIKIQKALLSNAAGIINDRAIEGPLHTPRFKVSRTQVVGAPYLGVSSVFVDPSDQVTKPSSVGNAFANLIGAADGVIGDIIAIASAKRIFENLDGSLDVLPKVKLLVHDNRALIQSAIILAKIFRFEQPIFSSANTLRGRFVLNIVKGILEQPEIQSIISKDIFVNSPLSATDINSFVKVLLSRTKKFSNSVILSDSISFNTALVRSINSTTRSIISNELGKINTANISVSDNFIKGTVNTDVAKILETVLKGPVVTNSILAKSLTSKFLDKGDINLEVNLKALAAVLPQLGKSSETSLLSKPLVGPNINDGITMAIKMNFFAPTSQYSFANTKAFVSILPDITNKNSISINSITSKRANTIQTDTVSLLDIHSKYFFSNSNKETLLIDSLPNIRPLLIKKATINFKDRAFPGIFGDKLRTLVRVYSLPQRRALLNRQETILYKEEINKRALLLKLSNVNIKANALTGRFLSNNIRTSSSTSKIPLLVKKELVNYKEIIFKQFNSNKVSGLNIVQNFIKGNLSNSLGKTTSIITKKPMLQKTENLKVEDFIAKQFNANKTQTVGMVSNKVLGGILKVSFARTFLVKTKRPMLAKTENLKLENPISKIPLLAKSNTLSIKDTIIKGRRARNNVSSLLFVTKRPMLAKTENLKVDDPISKFVKTIKVSRPNIVAIPHIGNVKNNNASTTQKVIKFFKKDLPLAQISRHPFVEDNVNVSITRSSVFNETPLTTGSNLIGVSVKADFDYNSLVGHGRYTGTTTDAIGNTSTHPLTYNSKINIGDSYPGIARAAMHITVATPSMNSSMYGLRYYPVPAGHDWYNFNDVNSALYLGLYMGNNYRYSGSSASVTSLIKIGNYYHIKTNWTQSDFSVPSTTGVTAKVFTRLILPKGGLTPGFTTLNITHGATGSDSVKNNSYYNQNAGHDKETVHYYQTGTHGGTRYRDLWQVDSNWTTSGLGGSNKPTTDVGILKIISSTASGIVFEHISAHPVYLVNPTYPGYVPTLLNNNTTDYTSTKTFVASGGNIKEKDTLVLPSLINNRIVEVQNVTGTNRTAVGYIGGTNNSLESLGHQTLNQYIAHLNFHLPNDSAAITVIGTSTFEVLYGTPLNGTDPRLQLQDDSITTIEGVKSFTALSNDNFTEKAQLTIPSNFIDFRRKYTVKGTDGTITNLSFTTQEVDIFNSFNDDNNSTLLRTVQGSNLIYTHTYNNEVLSSDPRVLGGVPFEIPGPKALAKSIVSKGISNTQTSSPSVSSIFSRGRSLKSSSSATRGFREAKILKNFTIFPSKTFTLESIDTRILKLTSSTAHTKDTFIKGRLLPLRQEVKSLVSKHLDQSPRSSGVGVVSAVPFFNQQATLEMILKFDSKVFPAYAFFPKSSAITKEDKFMFFTRGADFSSIRSKETVSKYIPRAKVINSSTTSVVFPAFATFTSNTISLNTSKFKIYKVKRIEDVFAITKSIFSSRAVKTITDSTIAKSIVLKGLYRNNNTVTLEKIQKFYSTKKDLLEVIMESKPSVKISNIQKSTVNIKSSLVRGIVFPTNIFTVAQLDEATRIIYKNNLDKVLTKDIISKHLQGAKSSSMGVSDTIIGINGRVKKNLTNVSSERPFFSFDKNEVSIIKPKSLIENELMKFFTRDLTKIVDSGFLFNQSYSSGYFYEGYVGEERIF